MYTPNLLTQFPIVSDQVNSRELHVILHQLEQCLMRGKPGAVVEFGCYVGTTSLFIQRLLEKYNVATCFHVYDSFAGLPAKTIDDSSPLGLQFTTGQLCASKKEFTRQFKKAGLALPNIHKGWFAALTEHDVPDDIIFAFLDGDYYESIRDSLRLITPNLVSGAVVVVDDYTNDALPGAAKAVDEWRRAHSAAIHIESSLAVLSIQDLYN